jgi:hypothetical protein
MEDESIKEILNKNKELNIIKEYRRKERNKLRKTEGMGERSRNYFRNLQVGCLFCTENKNSPSLSVLCVCGYAN